MKHLRFWQEAESTSEFIPQIKKVKWKDDCRDVGRAKGSARDVLASRDQQQWDVATVRIEELRGGNVISSYSKSQGEVYKHSPGHDLYLWRNAAIARGV